MTKRVEWEDHYKGRSSVALTSGEDGFQINAYDGNLAVFYVYEAPQLINAIAEVCGLTVMIGDQPPVYDAHFSQVKRDIAALFERRLMDIRRADELEERVAALESEQAATRSALYSLEAIQKAHGERIATLESAWLHDDEPQDEPEPLERIDAKLDTILDRITAPDHKVRRLGEDKEFPGESWR